MFRLLEFENFKCFGSTQSIKLAPITLIYGANSSGKSSILQLLCLLKQTLETDKPDIKVSPKGNLVDLGTFSSLIFQHDINKTLSIALVYSISDLVRRSNRYFPAAHRYTNLSFKCLTPKSRKTRDGSLIRIDQGFVQPSSELSGFSVDMSLQRQEDDKKEGPYYEFADLQSRQALASYFNKHIGAKPELKATRLKSLRLQFLGFHRTLPLARDLDISLRRVYRGLDEAARVFLQTVGRINYLGPLRMQAARFYESTSYSAHTVGIRGEDTADAISDNKVIRAKINNWFNIFDVPYKLSIRDIGNDLTGKIRVMELRHKNTSILLSPSDVGCGITQLLPIIVEGLLCKERTILVEQPEIHLHPRLQAHLADFFIQTSKTGLKGSSNNQWIIETHSEALMLRIQKRIRDGTIKSKDVQVLYVKQDPSGQSNIHQLRLDKAGEFIDEWPDGFFEESFYEVFGKECSLEPL